LAPIVPPPPPAPDSGVKFAEEMDIILDVNPILAMNPFASSIGSPAAWAYNMVYDRLVYFLGDGEYGPMLAKSWETTDWQNFTFHLRDDVYFHNGEHFTAQDVVYTIGMAKEAVGTLSFDRWSTVSTATVIDPYTLKIVLSGVNVDFFFELSQPMAGIVNEKAISADAEKGTWIGTGCFYVTEFLSNDYVKLARNDDYWGEKALTQRITIRHVPEMSAKLMQLQNGQADVVFALDPVDMPVVEADTEHFVCYKYTDNHCNMIGFNMEDPITSDLNFRMAVAHALDRDEIRLAAVGYYGFAETEGTYWGYETEFKNRGIPVIPYDPDKALEYLAASPYNGETLEITSAMMTNILAAEVVQEQLGRIGINIKINAMDIAGLGAYCRYGENQSQILVHTGMTSLSAASIRTWYYPGANRNRTSYNNPEITALLDEAITLTDINERRALYMHIQELLADDPTYINLFRREDMAACVISVGGLILIPDSYHDLRYIYKIID